MLTGANSEPVNILGANRLNEVNQIESNIMDAIEEGL
jgi:hypothetical protein